MQWVETKIGKRRAWTYSEPPDFRATVVENKGSFIFYNSYYPSHLPAPLCRCGVAESVWEAMNNATRIADIRDIDDDASVLARRRWRKEYKEG